MGGPGTPSLLDLDLGFLALSRRLWASAWFMSLRSDEKVVCIDVLVRARYAAGGEFWFAGHRIPLGIGELIDSEEEIARRLRVTRKIVRGTLTKMANVGLIRRRKAHPAGRCPFITTVLDYERIQPASAKQGPRAGPPTEQQGAREGDGEEACQRAPSEQGNQANPGEPGEPGELSAGRPARESEEPARPTGPVHADEEAGEADLEWLRQQLAARLGRGIGGCGRDAGRKMRLQEQLQTYGRAHVLEAAVEVDGILQRKGYGPLGSLAALPGYLDGMDQPPTKGASRPTQETSP